MGPILQVVAKVVLEVDTTFSAKRVCLVKRVVVGWRPSSPNFGLVSEFRLLRECSIMDFILLFDV